MKWFGFRVTCLATDIIGFTASTFADNIVNTTGTDVMMIDRVIIATTIANKLNDTKLHQHNLLDMKMKKLTLVTSLFSILAGVMLISCASDKTATQSTTTTRQTTVTQPAATQTTTTRSTTGY